jgi:signal transduction histidine kinase
MPSDPNSYSRIRTLRFRLMAWNAAVVIMTALVTLLGLREGVRYTLIHELDQLLSEDVREIELALADVSGADSPLLHEQLDRKDAGHAQHKWFVQLISSAGQTLYQSQHAPRELPHLTLPSNSLSAPRNQLLWRVFDRAANGVTIRVGSSLELIHADVGRIDRLVALAVAVVLLIAPLSGYWLAGRATAPLNEMITTMAQVHPSRLDQRLRIRGTRDELDQLSSVFNGLLDRIASYLQEHRDLLANSAHELRTPLAAIRSSIEVALSKDRSHQEYTSLLSEIIDESSSLELLVNQLLLLSETEAERLKVNAATVRFDELLERAVDMFSGVAEYRDIGLTCGPLPVVSLAGNPQHLRQVIYNLLDNALKFTRPEGRVQVALELVGQQALFTVRDTGVGIRPQDMTHLFERFFRGQHGAMETDVKGTGLGLCICRAIVHAHGGSIDVTSQFGQGTCFTVKFPLAKNAPGPGC